MVIIPKIATGKFRQTIELSTHPILLEFYTDWCPTCRIMDPILNRLRREFRGSALIFRVDAEAEWELVREFGIQGVPSFVILRNARVHSTLVGRQTIDKLRHELVWAGAGIPKRGVRPRIAGP